MAAKPPPIPGSEDTERVSPDVLQKLAEETKPPHLASDPPPMTPLRPRRRLLTYFVGLPNDLLFGWPAVFLIWLFWGTGLRWEREALICQLKENSWPARTWYRVKRYNPITGRREYVRITGGLADGQWLTWGGTTLGHAIFYGVHRRLAMHPRDWTSLQVHEHVHVEQCEASMLRSFLVALGIGIELWLLGHPTAAIVSALVIWTFGYWAMGIGGWVTAWLRGEDAYRGSHHEEAAYAIDAQHE
jgi:hypothetical protein